VLLGFTVPVLARNGAEHGLAEHFEHLWRPISAGIAVPVFAFFAAGVSLRGTDLGAIATDPIVLGIVAGSVIAATLAAVVLSRRNKVYRRLQERASRDSDADGVPDIDQSSPRPADHD
jgi:Na+/H+ antiporter NhaA